MKALRAGWERWWSNKWVTEPLASPAAWDADPEADLEVVVLHPDYPGWRFRVTFSAAGQPVGFSVKADQVMEPRFGGRRSRPMPPPPITARWLRDLPVGVIQEVARLGIVDRSTQVRFLEDSGWAETLRRAARPGRGGRDDFYFASVAADYVAALRKNSRNPVAALASMRGVSPATVRNLVHEARRRGLLTPSLAGRAGGELTEKAKALLREQKENPR